MNDSTPAFEESYPLLTLPRIPDLDLSEKVFIPNISSIDSTVIDIGISKSIISSYIIKPTPKLVWSYALSPTSTLECMDVVEQSSGVKVYAIGISDRKKHKLILLERNSTTTNDNQNGVDANTNVRAHELKVSRRIKGVKLFNDGSIIVVIYENGNIEVINKSEDESGETVLAKSKHSYSQANNSEKLAFYEFINDIEISNTIQAGGNKELLFLVFDHADHVTYKLYSLNFQTSLFEINSSVVSKTAPKSTKLSFAYNSGHLYQLDNATGVIHDISITNFKRLSTTNVASLIEDQALPVTLYSPSPQRLVLSNGSKIHLINVKFVSLLATFESETAANPDVTLVNQIVKVKGNSLRTSRSMLCYLNSKSKENNVDLNVVNVNVGLNKLSECLGKKIPITSETVKPPFQGLPNLLDENFSQQLQSLTQELNQVYKTLCEARDANDLNKWERILVPYLKMESWDSIKKSLNKKSGSKKDYTFQEFDIENDRTVDCNFISEILSLIFEIDSESNQVSFKSLEFIPEFTLIYLLTNPIFPAEYTNGLLELLDETNQDILLRQAIMTCPNLSIVEILKQILNSKYTESENNSQIFEDLLNRIIGEFSVHEITVKFKQLLANEVNKDDPESVSINLDQLLNKLLQVKNNNNSWYFIELLIDVGGLFNWSISTIDTLSELINTKVDSLVHNNYNLTLVNQAILQQEPTKRKRPGKKSKKGKNDIVAKNSSHNSQLDSILTINNNTTNRNLLHNDGVSRKVPNYSIERLVV